MMIVKFKSSVILRFSLSVFESPSANTTTFALNSPLLLVFIAFCCYIPSFITPFFVIPFLEKSFFPVCMKTMYDSEM